MRDPDETEEQSNARYRKREAQRETIELIAGAAAARYVATLQNGERVLAERIAIELTRRAAAALGIE